jgi:hypothetical protein
MKNIENYKTRFYTLMESTMGDVKPLISEAPQYEEYVEPEKEDFYIFLESLDEGYGKIEITEKSYSNYEYKITVKPGSYEPNEELTLTIRVNVNSKKSYKNNVGLFDDYLKVSSPLKYSGDAIRGKLKTTFLTSDDLDNPPRTIIGDKLNAFWNNNPKADYTIMLKFKMPSTQKEYDSIKPFSKYAEVKFDNVRGGKIKFTILFPDVTINE